MAKTKPASADPPGAAAVRKYSLTVAGHRTSISLEAVFWDQLRGLAAARGLSLPALVGEIDARRDAANLSSALRVHVLEALLSRPESPVHGEFCTATRNPTLP
jgi:predicted DNA-binding ribbon-helix-helix protein